ncbi:MAG: glycoside hydrolase family 3 protein [Cellulomonadaceae bacterium]|nr:glycoside hydrolase family 3 protein [Cellulomonadaceae bacterium]
MNVHLRAAPFNLSDEQVEWVDSTLAGMTVEAKVGQLFCASVGGFSAKAIRHLCKDVAVGGVMFRAMAASKVRESAERLQASSDIPLLLAANLESGGNGIASDGTYFAMPSGVAATRDPRNGYRLGKIACSEAAAVGVNWSFAPIVDVDVNYRNPITNVRTFGADPDLVAEMSLGYLAAAQEEGVAASLKHFPGDGVDERDQHLLVSVNSLPAVDWWNSFGDVYSRLIAAGAPTVMAGHIALPSVAREIDPTISDEDALLPGSLSTVLLDGLLRERLGFNGLVVTDSTLMVGFMQVMSRRRAVPLAIERGCDMILFSRNLDEDYAYALDGVRDGLLSKERLDEAVTRILALKASLDLPSKKARGRIVPPATELSRIASEESKAWTRECADKAITLVKDRRAMLPLDAARGRRVYLNVIENFAKNNSTFARDIKARLEREGFEVTLRKRKLDFDPDRAFKGGLPNLALLRIMREVSANTEAFVSQFDLCVIVLNMETVSNATVVRVDWKVMFGLGNDIPWYAGELPLLAISTANPYHLLDVPMAHAYINAYSNNGPTLDALFDKVMGRSEFMGVAPSDAFCGHEDCAL